MRIKYRIEDFVVHEELKKVEPGEHYLYLIRKADITTWDVQRLIARHFRVAPRLLSFCGLKDRNAIAFQYMSSPRRLAEQHRVKKFELELVGRIDHALGAGDLLANHFEIMIRDLKRPSIERFLESIDEVKAAGLANYFDEQRFESRLGADDFVARRLMLGQYEGALRLLIAQPLKLDSSELKQFKRLAVECWGEWRTLGRLAPKKYQALFRQLERAPDAVGRALNFFEHDYLEFLISAFQSFLWNEVAQRFLRRVAPDGFEFGYFLGRFYFYHRIEGCYFDYQIPVLNHQTVIEDRDLVPIYEQVLEEMNLSQGMLKIKFPERIRVKSFNRPLVARPVFDKVAVIDDAYFRGQAALALNFSLGSGSYATLLIKRLVGPKQPNRNEST